MKFKVYNEEKLELLGQDAVGALIYEILNKGILEEFCHGISRIDYKEELSNEIKFARTLDMHEDADYILFHLVMFSTTLLKLNSLDYIVKKKLFGGYESDMYKAFSFNTGLEKGLNNFRGRGKITQIRQIKANNSGGIIEYYSGDYLSKSIPYFFYEHTKLSLNEITVNFAENIAYIRKPENPKIVISVFCEKAKELVPLAHKILQHFFVDIT